MPGKGQGFMCVLSRFRHLTRMLSQLMSGEFLQQFLRVIGKRQQDVLTPLGWPQWRTTYHITTSVWKMPPSWHWQTTLKVIGASGGMHWNGAKRTMMMMMMYSYKPCRGWDESLLYVVVLNVVCHTSPAAHSLASITASAYVHTWYIHIYSDNVSWPLRVLCMVSSFMHGVILISSSVHFITIW